MEGIARFVCRACPFLSPYPNIRGPHWEFTATTTNGKQVGLHPPGRKGKLTHTFASDDERQAALAAVARKGVSEKVRACYFDTLRPRTQPRDRPTHTQFPAVDPGLLRATTGSETVAEFARLMSTVG